MPDTSVNEDIKRIKKVRHGMLHRCYNSISHGYHRYGGRGIIVCYEWRNNCKSFIDWALSNNYRQGLQIDRINNDGNYEPDNYRWVTNKENCRNTCRTLVVDYKGEKRKFIELKDEIGGREADLIYKTRMLDEFDVTSYDYIIAYENAKMADRQIQLKELAEIINKSISFTHVLNFNSIKF